MARNTKRPIRPNPLIPTLVVIGFPFRGLHMQTLTTISFVAYTTSDKLDELTYSLYQKHDCTQSVQRIHPSKTTHNLKIDHMAQAYLHQRNACEQNSSHALHALSALFFARDLLCELFDPTNTMVDRRF